MFIGGVYPLVGGVYSCQVVMFEKINPTIRRGFIACALYGVRFAIYLTLWGVIRAETIQLYVYS